MSSPSLSPRGDMRPRSRASAFRTTAVLLVAGFVGAHSVGCSFVLPLVASGSDDHAAGRLLPAEDLLELESGVRLRIADTTGTRAEGTFRGIAQDSDSAYAPRYERFLATAAVLGVPRLGEHARLVPRSILGKVAVQSGRFAGFDYRGVLLSDDAGRVKRYEMIRVDSLWREDGRGVSGLQLASLDADHALPSRTVLLVDQSAHDASGVRRTRRVRVPWESARLVQAVGRGSQAGAAMVAGLVIDGLIVYALTRPHEHHSYGCDMGSLPPGWPFMAQSALRHVHTVEHDFDRVAGTFVESGPALAAR